MVAEGIEDLESYHALAELGCDVGQGYFIGRPMGSTELLLWLRNRAATRRPRLAA